MLLVVKLIDLRTRRSLDTDIAYRTHFVAYMYHVRDACVQRNETHRRLHYTYYYKYSQV